MTVSRTVKHWKPKVIMKRVGEVRWTDEDPTGSEQISQIRASLRRVILQLWHHEAINPCLDKSCANYFCTVQRLDSTLHTHAGSKARLGASFLIPQRLDVINLLHGLCSQYKRMLFLHAYAVFDTDAHTAEVGWVSVGVGDVEAALIKVITEK